MIDDKIAAIRRTPLFGELEEAELRVLAVVPPFEWGGVGLHELDPR